MTVKNRIVTGTRLLLLLAATGVVCLAQMPPIDSGNYAAKVLTLTGQVSVLKDSTPWALEVGDQIQVKQLIMTGADGQATFQVSDGSTFVVYPNSRVVFRKNAPNWKDAKQATIGEARSRSSVRQSSLKAAEGVNLPVVWVAGTFARGRGLPSVGASIFKSARRHEHIYRYFAADRR